MQWQALIDFENVLAMEPKNYVGDNFSRITDIYRVTQYNIACCYAAQGSVRPYGCVKAESSRDHGRDLCRQDGQRREAVKGHCTIKGLLN